MKLSWLPGETFLEGADLVIDYSAFATVPRIVHCIQEKLMNLSTGKGTGRLVKLLQPGLACHCSQYREQNGPIGQSS